MVIHNGAINSVFWAFANSSLCKSTNLPTSIHRHTRYFSSSCFTARVELEQGDQTSFRKNHPKYSPTHFSSELIHNFYSAKNSPKLWATVTKKKLPKVINRPKGIGSPNLVTLTVGSTVDCTELLKYLCFFSEGISDTVPRSFLLRLLGITIKISRPYH
jgi:hypothetical protein